VRAEFTQEAARRFSPPPQPVCRSELATASEAETPEQRRQVALTRERIGYRLVRSAQASAAMPPSPAAAIIAVIPFAIINGVPEQEYFADGTWRN
jgi:hypothetical protein